ncbi:heparin lyase I family protein [Bradyrhizobium jicamae]|nr:heparin lyase I family protein [Bradyrhizobium jicamae]
MHGNGIPFSQRQRGATAVARWRPELDTTGTIASFSSTPKTRFTIGGDSYEVQGAGKSYSLSSPDAQTLQFELQPGDYAWFDTSSVDRDEIAADQLIQPGTPIGIDYQFMVQPNGSDGSFTNTASWFVAGEMHNDDLALGSTVHTSPPFAMQLDGNHLQLVARYALPGGNPSNGSPDLHMLTLWTDPNPIVPGQYYDINIQANVSNTSAGYLDLSINGTKVVNYSGPLGYGAPTYWEEGLYRNAGPTQTVTADFRNLTLVTGSMASGWTGVGGSSTTPPVTTPPTPVTTPAVTQATASPATGTEVVGNTITLALGFNEAVTVTGTPTLSLNDGNTATYVSGSGTGTLTFKTTVASTDTSTSALAITGVNLPSGASIKDASGVAANLSAALTTFAGLQIDPTQPAVTQATASPGTGLELVGSPITLTLGFNEAVTVAGAPTLALNDGDTATYVSGSGTGALTFKTTVASTDTSTSALAITGVNLPSGASIKDASGVAANLAGAVTTFSGLQIDPPPSPPTSPNPPTTSPLPLLTITDNTLTVTKGGGTVGLGTNVSTNDPNGVVTVNIKGLPKYETITDQLDGRTFSGKSITLTEAEVDSGLTLQSNYHGNGTPVATLTLTATGKDSVTGTVATSASQTITVTDPAPATATSPASTLANQGFALLNQHLAGNTGHLDHGQIVAAVSNGEGLVHDGVLTRPQH